MAKKIKEIFLLPASTKIKLTYKDEAKLKHTADSEETYKVLLNQHLKANLDIVIEEDKPKMTVKYGDGYSQVIIKNNYEGLVQFIAKFVD